MRRKPATRKRIRARISTAPTPRRSSRSSRPSVCAVPCAWATSRPNRSGRSKRSTSMYASELGCTIRQIARASAEDNGAVFAAVRPALVPLASGFGRDRGQPESRHGPRRVRRRDVVLRLRRRRLADRSRGRVRRAVGGRPTAEPVAGQRAAADGAPQGERRLRRAALRALHRQRQARHPRRGDRRATPSTASTSRACCSCRSSARIGCRLSRRSRNAPSRCSIARWPKCAERLPRAAAARRCRFFA